MKTISLLFLLLFSLSAFSQQEYEANWESLDSRPVPEWFTDAKFGIFIHWGVYSVPAWAPASEDIGVYAKYAEWYWKRINSGSESNQNTDKVNQLFTDYHHKKWGENFKYQDFAPLWKTDNFDANQWADIFKKAGAKYVVMTSKHHEGFSLWPSAENWNWNSVDIGPHRDLCGEFAKAIKENDLHLGFYYSLYEWFNPLYQSNPEKYVSDYMLPQMKDLVNRYQPELLYPDGEWDHPSALWKSEAFLAWLYNDSPTKESIVVNDRWGKETRGKHGGFYTTEYGLIHADDAGDMSAHPWEEIRGIGTSFGYNQMEDLNHYLSSEALIHLLVKTVSNGGNLCLNVGPTADGRIPVIQQQRLLDIGQWLMVNGDAIYGTKHWKNEPTKSPDSPLHFTQNNTNLYAILTSWSQKPIEIEKVEKPTSVVLLGYNGVVKYKWAKQKLTIYPPLVSPSQHKITAAWSFKIENALN